MTKLNKGNILLSYKGEESSPCIYMVYDKNVAIGTNFFTTFTIPTSKIDDYIAVCPNMNISWSKRKRLNKILSGIISKDIKLSFKERIRFLEYIAWIYKDILGIEIVEHPLSISIRTLIKSTRMSVYNNRKNYGTND